MKRDATQHITFLLQLPLLHICCDRCATQEKVNKNENVVHTKSKSSTVEHHVVLVIKALKKVMWQHQRA